MAETSLAPWAMTAVVFDDPLGESESFERFVGDGIESRLVWAIPAHDAEARLIAAEGIEALDRLVAASDVSLADVRRPDLVPATE